jgi:hypothetical protein
VKITWTKSKRITTVEPGVTAYFVEDVEKYGLKFMIVIHKGMVNNYLWYVEIWEEGSTEENFISYRASRDSKGKMHELCHGFNDQTEADYIEIRTLRQAKEIAEKWVNGMATTFLDDKYGDKPIGVTTSEFIQNRWEELRNIESGKSTEQIQQRVSVNIDELTEEVLKSNKRGGCVTVLVAILIVVMML